MSPEQENPASTGQGFDAVLAEYLQQADRGQAADRTAFLARYPQFTAELRQYFDDEDAMRGLWPAGASDGACGPSGDRAAPAEAARQRGGEPDGEPAPTLDGSAPAAGGSQPSAAAPPSAQPQHTLGGRFRIREFLAAGGLGRVLVAEDVELGRKVAVKEIKPDYADQASARQRFVLEAEITGGLEHPCIVPVYGRGSYPDGRPYYAMRLISGETLRNAADGFHQQLAQDPTAPWPMVELHKLLRRFIDVCHAVQFAHSRGVIHRDLKPANVMLGKYGETLLVDWGLAKVIGRADAVRDFAEETLRLRSGSGSSATEAGSTIGTPAYMSPEQAAGDPEQVGLSSDVYGLGATLYYLLTGQIPFTGKTAQSILAQVKRGEFPRPRQVRAACPAALEAICLRAMALSPADRYPTPSDLIQDLERWLGDEPVSAYQETRSERLARWMRRHRAGVQAAGAILLSLFLISTVAALAITRAWRNERIAREAAVESKAEAVMRFRQARESIDRWLTGAGHELGLYPGLQKTRLRLLEQAAADYEQLVRAHSEDYDLELERGRTYVRLGHLRLSLEDASGASQAYQTARQLFTEAAERHPGDRTCQVELADCRINLGLAALESPDAAVAQQEYEAAIGLLEPLLQQSDDARARGSLATALLNRGELLGALARLDEAEHDLRRAIDIAAPLVKQESASTGPLMTAIAAKTLLGFVLTHRGQFTAGLESLSEAADDADRLVKRSPGKPRHWETRAGTRSELARHLGHLGRWSEEAEAYRLAAEDYKRLEEILPGVPKFVENRVLTQIDAAALRQRLGQLTLAEQQLADAAQCLAGHLEQNPNSWSLRERWAYCRDLQGEILRDRGKFEESQRFLGDALDFHERLLSDAAESGPEVRLQFREAVAVARSHLAQTLHLRDELPQAEQQFQLSIAALEEILDATSERLPLTRHRLAFVRLYYGNLFEALGKPEEARRQWAAARQLWSELAAAPDAAAEHRYALAWFLANAPAEELRDADRAAILAQRLTADAPQNPVYRMCLGAALCRTGRWPQAAEALEQAIGSRLDDDGRDWYFLAMVRWHSGDQPGARDAYRRAAAWRAETMPGNQDARRLDREVAELLGEPVNAG